MFLRFRGDVGSALVETRIKSAFDDEWIVNEGARCGDTYLTIEVAEPYER